MFGGKIILTIQYENSNLNMGWGVLEHVWHLLY